MGIMEAMVEGWKEQLNYWIQPLRNLGAQQRFVRREFQGLVMELVRHAQIDLLRNDCLLFWSGHANDVLMKSFLEDHQELHGNCRGS
jgi:hypothetical protein